MSLWGLVFVWIPPDKSKCLPWLSPHHLLPVTSQLGFNPGPQTSSHSPISEPEDCQMFIIHLTAFCNHSLWNRHSLHFTLPWLETELRITCTSDHNRNWGRNPLNPNPWAGLTNALISGQDNFWTVNPFGSTICSNTALSWPALLIIWWFLKPKVVFNPPQSKLHCMSSQLKTMFVFVVA